MMMLPEPQNEQTRNPTGTGLVVVEVHAWADRINRAWDRSIEAIFETGRHLIAATGAGPLGCQHDFLRW